MAPHHARAWMAAAAIAAAAAPACAAAQAEQPAGITLEQALTGALSNGTGVRLARERQAASAGAARAATAPFDVQLSSYLGSTRDETLRWEGSGAPAVKPSQTLGVTYGFSVDKRFRSGVVVGPEISARRAMQSPHVEARNNTATAAMVVQLPVMRGRGAVNTAGERAAATELSAAGHDVVHAAALGTLATATAYWAYVSAGDRLEVQRQAEARARRLVEETRALVAAQERPAADLNQLQANLAFREAARIGAEQDVEQARAGLGVAMGLPPREVTSLPAPATPFPAADHAWAALSPDSLVERALERRADLGAARLGTRSARELADAAVNAMRPRLDLAFSVGYTGAEPGDAWSRLVTPLYRSFSAWTAGLEVTWQAAARNAEAQGVAEQRRAAERQRLLEAEDVERSIRAGVIVAAQAVRHGLLELERSDEAVRLYRTVVENEERKFNLGMSTLFDVLQAEDGLTSALTAQTSARERYADALARLAYETGTLVTGDAADLRVEVAAVSPPAPPAPR